MTGQAAEKIITGGVEDLTEDQIAEVDRVLMILRGLRRSEAAMRNSLVEGMPDERVWERFCFGEGEEGV